MRIYYIIYVPCGRNPLKRIDELTNKQHYENEKIIRANFYTLRIIRFL